LSRESVTNDLKASTPDHAPQQPQPQHCRKGKADHGYDVDAEHVRSALGEDPDQRRPDQPSRDDHRDDVPVEHYVEAVEQVVEPFVHEPDLDLSVAHLFERVVQLVRQLERYLTESQALFPRAHGHLPRPEAVEQQTARVRTRHLEHIEVRVEVDADRAERRDRAVEQQEARRQLQVHGVDELERLADDLQRVDLRQTRAVVAIEDLAQFGEELLLALLRVTHAKIGQPLRQRIDVLGRG